MAARLHVIRTLYPHWGSHSGIHQFLGHLDPGRFQVEVHAAADGDDDFPLRHPVLRRRLRDLVQRGGMSWYKLSDLRAEASAFAGCWRGRADLVHYLDGEHSAQYLPSLPRRGVPVVASFHQPPELLPDVLNDRAVRRLDRAIAVSPTQVPWLAERLGPDRVELILHGIDTGFFRPRREERAGDGPFRCITVGHYLRDFQVIGEVVRRLAGRGFAFDVVTNRATGLEGLPGVHRHQDVNDDRLLALYQQADALLLPVTQSTANNALLEGIACGLPVISSRLPSIEAYVPDSAALLVEGNDPDELAWAVLRLRDNPGLARGMGRRARERAEELAWPRIAPRYAAIYDTLASGTLRRNGARQNGGREERGRQEARFSVIIPARNAVGTLAESLSSLRAQTFSAWEAIVVDDGSTDRTAEIARDLAAADPRIRVTSGPGRGPSVARNTGIAQARSDWLLFLDADDLLEPTYLERMAGVLDGGEMDGAICGWARMAPDGRRGPAHLPEDGDLFARLARYCAFAIHTCVVRRTQVEEVGGFDPSLLTCEEWDLWQRLARAGARFAAVPEVLALYRQRPGSASHDSRRLLEDGLRVIARGHAPDPRVPRPDPAHAGGRPPREQATARLLFSCWAAGLAAGRDEDPRPLLAALDGDRDPGLDPCAAARSLFQAALLPLGGMPAEWRERWPEVEARCAAFLEGLGETAGARHFAALARREIERLAVEHAGASRPLTLGRTCAVRIELTRPIADLQVPAPAERLSLSATLEGEEIGTVELPVAGGTATARLLADALADCFAWTVLARFFARQGKDPFGWELFLQEIWGRPDWPMARFYDPEAAKEEAPLAHPSDGRIEIEASGEVLAVELSGPADAVLRVGGATIGRVRLLRSEGRMGAHELRTFLTGASGFELCRAAVREGLLGQPLDAPGTLRERLAEAARRQTSNGSVDLRGAVLARHPRAPLASPSSRRAFLPAEALPELLDLALATGQSVILPPAGPAPRWAEYAPDLFAEPAALGPAGSCAAAPPSPVYGRQHFEALFAAGADPWKYTNSYEETKYEQTLSLLPEGPIGQALELACAEGHFTVRLAPRVESLVAADISRIALERAAGRCDGLANVEFRHLDLTRDPLPAGFDLVVCSEVLYFAGDVPKLQEAARRLAAALAPGGHLLTVHARLVADEPDGPGFDWDFPFGSRTIGEALAAAGLRLVRELRTPLYRIQLFQRDPGPQAPTVPPRIEDASPGPLPPEVARHVLWNGGQPSRSDSPPDVRTWRLPILLYHRIAPEGSEATARYRVTPEAFAEQLRFLRDSGYHTPRLGDWLRAQESKEPLPGRAVLITFDDGYRDFAEHACRLLDEHGFSALVFLVADAVGGTNHWDEAYGERLPLLGWDEIRCLQSRGIQFGSHAASHSPLTALSPAEAVRELARSRTILTRKLGAPPEAIAYPHGATDPVVQHLAGACGYFAGLTCNPMRSGFDDPPLALPRLEVRGDASFADFVALLEGS